MNTTVLILSILGGLGVFLAFGGLALWPRQPRIQIAQRDRFRGDGVGSNLAYRLAGGRETKVAGTIEKQLKAANWYWGPGETQAPDPSAPYHTVAGYQAACTYQALTLGAGGLVGASILATGVGLPIWIAPLLAGLLAYVGYLTPKDQLTAAVRRRHKRMTLEMAFRLPELAATVATGRSIIQALRELTRRPGGPLATEMVRLLRTYDLTQSLEAATNVTVQHNRFEPLTEMLRQILFVEQQGGSIGPALNVLATAAQERLHQQLEAQGDANKRDMGLPVVGASVLVMLLLIAGPMIWVIMNAL
jgi:Flp pilus assembly protein TadB